MLLWLSSQKSRHYYREQQTCYLGYDFSQSYIYRLEFYLSKTRKEESLLVTSCIVPPHAPTKANMSVSATETETLWSTQPSPTFSRFTLRGPSLQDEPVNDDDLFPSFDAAAQYSDADQASNLASTSASHSAHSMQQQTPQSQPDNGKPLQILTSGLDDHILVTRDDTTIQDEPTHHVDYLTHPWSEEDVWSTWQYVLSKRSTLTAAARLENASWRCWGKCRNGGLTVPAEKIDWYVPCYYFFIHLSPRFHPIVIGFASSMRSCHALHNTICMHAT